MAPVFNLMEKEVLKKMRELIGWSRGSGIFAPGGSLSNLYGLMAARYHRFPESKTRGCAHLPQMAIFASCEVSFLCQTPSPPSPSPCPVSLLSGEERHPAGARDAARGEGQV
jgi:hypothetical protein